MGKPLDADLSSPWVLCRSSPVFSGESDSLRSLRSTRPPTVSPADFRSELGPRSLDPDRSFWSAFAELIRDQTQPDDFCNYNLRRAGNQTRALSILAGTETSISFLFFDVPRTRLAPRMTRGEPRYVHSTPPQCWFLSLA
jgi:hypothetical protein